MIHNSGSIYVNKELLNDELLNDIFNVNTPDGNPKTKIVNDSWKIWYPKEIFFAKLRRNNKSDCKHTHQTQMSIQRVLHHLQI